MLWPHQGMGSLAPSVARWLAFYLVVLAFVGGSCAPIALAQPHRLITEGVQTNGTVVAKEVQRKRLVRYEFTAGTRTHSGTDSVRSPLVYGDVRVGDAVPVRYVPARPEVSLIGDERAAQAEWRSSLMMLGLVAAVLPAFLVFTTWRLFHYDWRTDPRLPFPRGTA